MSSLLQTHNISKRYGVNLLFEGINLSIDEGDKIALIAKNGTGKSTLLKILAGLETVDEGEISSKQSLRLGYLPQDIILNPEKTILDAVLNLDSPTTNAVRDYETAMKTGSPEILQKAIDLMDSLNAWDLELKMKQILSSLKIDQTKGKLGELSGGQQKRVALSAVLLEDPDFLILDEPTNHLDLSMIEWLEQFLIQSGKTLLMVTHDRYFLDRVCNVIIEIDDNAMYTYQGNYSYYLEKRQERKENQLAVAEKATNLLRSESEWMRRMPKARGTKAKFRIDNYYELKKQAQVRRETALQIAIPSKRLGNKVFDIYNLSKAYGDIKLIYDFSYKFAPFEKIGIVGDNGSGKSTFLNILTGLVKQDSGRIEMGQTVNLSYYHQSGMNFNEDDRIIDAVTKIAESVNLDKDKVFSAQQFLQYFMFPIPKQQQRIADLSGGEKRRLYLCTVLMTRPNFLILDEPTNDLDIITLQVLEDYLEQFDGCVLIVSHDRFFMDKIVDHIFAFDGNGNVKDFPGNYSVYRSKMDEIEQSRKNSVSGKNDDVLKKDSKKSNVNYENRLSYKEKMEFEKLEIEIEALTEAKSEIEKQLNSGSLSADELHHKYIQFSEISQNLDEKEFRWLELSEKKA
jgi:ABC transport system ATP-binding/permease protein